MKTEEHSEATAVFLHKLTAAVAELKEQLQHDYEQLKRQCQTVVVDKSNWAKSRALARLWESTFIEID